MAFISKYKQKPNLTIQKYMIEYAAEKRGLDDNRIIFEEEKKIVKKGYEGQLLTSKV